MKWRKICLLAVASSMLLFAFLVVFARWPTSRLHVEVCGSNLPYAINARWLVNGPRMLEGWRARLCGCVAPPGFQERQELTRVHSNDSIRYLGRDNAGAIAVSSGEDLRPYFRSKG